MQRIQRGHRFSPDSFLMRQPQCGLLSLRRLEIAAEYKHVFFSTGRPDIFRCAFGAVLLLSFFLRKRLWINLIMTLCFSSSQDMSFFNWWKGSFCSLNVPSVMFQLLIFTPQFYIVRRSCDDCIYHVIIVFWSYYHYYSLLYSVYFFAQNDNKSCLNPTLWFCQHVLTHTSLAVTQFVHNPRLPTCR